MANLAEVLGTDVRQVLRNWALSVFLDDLVPGDAQYQQPTWDFRAIYSALGQTFNPERSDRALVSGSRRAAAIRGGSLAFFRFAVAAGEEAHLTLTASQQPPPGSVQLSLVRLR